MDIPSNTKSNRFGSVIVFAAFLSAFVYGLYRIRLGVNLTDEGFYLASATRYALGDIPFRDEFSNPHRMFDILLWPLFELHRDLSVYELRFVWLVFQIGSVVAFYHVFRRFAPGPLVAFACLATMFLPNLIWTPAYHLMGTFFFLLSWAIMFEGIFSESSRARLGLGALSGLAFFLGAFSYLPLLAVTIVPLSVLLLCLLRREFKSTIAIVMCAHLGTLFVCTLATVSTFGVLGLWGDWWEASNTILSLGTYKESTGQKVLRFTTEIAPQLYIALAVSAFVFVVIELTRRLQRLGRFADTPGGILLLSIAVAGLIYALLVRIGVPEPKPAVFDAYTQSLRIVMIALGLHLGALLSILIRGGANSDRGWRLVYTMTLSGALIFGLCHGYLSGMAWKSMFAIVPLFVSAIVLVYRSMVDDTLRAQAKLRPYAFAGAFCLAVGICSYQARVNYVFSATSLDAMTAEFSIDRLAGIKTDPENVLADLEGAVNFVTERVETGDYLLVDGHAPLFYYLTQTRPALDHCWTSVHISSALRRKSIRHMIDSKRVPRYVVRFLIYRPKIIEGEAAPSESEYPIAAFVAKYYLRDASFGPFEVWRLNDDLPYPATSGAGEDE